MQTNDNNIKNQSQEAEETGNKQTFYLQRYTADDDAAFKTDLSNQKHRREKKKKQMADIQGGRNKICQESFEQRAERGTRDANINSTGEPAKPAGTLIRRIVSSRQKDTSDTRAEGG